MRHLLLLALMLLPSVTITAQVQPIWPDNLDVLPRFTGGPKALSKYMNDNLQYPESAEKNGVEGKVYVLFNVEKDGTITDVKIGKSVDPDLDQEAVRLVKGMPKWEPGRKHGKATLVKNMRMPITFKIDKEGSSPNFASNSPSSPEKATFPGGQPALIKYTLDNFHYPENAKMNGLESKVSVSCWVESDGSIIDVSATSSANTDRLITKEALRLVKGMPMWIAGMRAGKLIRGYYTLYLFLRLNDEQSKTPMPFFSLGGPYKIEEGKDKQQIMESLFPGGQTALEQFLKENTKYQDIDPFKNRNSTSVVEFMVETDGSLTDLNIVEHIDSIHDNEALRVVKSMPKWIPAKNKDGEPSVYIYSLPISFKDSTKLINSKQIVIKEVLQLQPTVLFPWGKSTIDNVGYTMIEMVAKYLKNHPEYALIVKGYTSANMELKQSLKVSRDRAVAVKQALVKRYGIEAGRISAQGCGATQELSDVMEFNNVVLFFIKKRE